MENILQQIKDAVIKRQRKEIQGLVDAAIEEGIDPKTIIDSALITAMDVVGQKFTDSDIFVPEMLASALTMQLGLERVKPLLKSGITKPKGKIVLCTVKGDVHDIGKNIVAMMLEGAGFEVVDLGVDLTVEKLVERIETIRPDLLGLSALLTTTLPEMERVIQELAANGFREKLKIMVGGAPVTEAFAKKINADGYGANAAAAVQLARRLTNNVRAQ